jgi:ribulose-5-phosphate 4-epimerase/fuculose-1-phosphate aldolase
MLETELREKIAVKVPPAHDIASLEGKVSAEEWQLRVDLAATYRLIAMHGWDDMIFTHISARVPGPEHHFLINPYGLLFDEITASSLVKIDIDGNKVQETPYPVNPAGFTIHSALHMNRDDAHCIIHVHTDDGVAVSAQADGLLPLDQHAMMIAGDLAYHDYEGVALDLDERDRLVHDIGQERDDPAQSRHARDRQELRRCVHAHVLPGTRLHHAGARAGRRREAQLAEPGRAGKDGRAGRDGVRRPDRNAGVAGAAAQAGPRPIRVTRTRDTP